MRECAGLFQPYFTPGHCQFTNPRKTARTIDFSRKTATYAGSIAWDIAMPAALADQNNRRINLAARIAAAGNAAARHDWRRLHRQAFVGARKLNIHNSASSKTCDGELRVLSIATHRIINRDYSWLANGLLQARLKRGSHAGIAAQDQFSARVELQCAAVRGQVILGKPADDLSLKCRRAAVIAADVEGAKVARRASVERKQIDFPNAISFALHSLAILVPTKIILPRSALNTLPRARAYRKGQKHQGGGRVIAARRNSEALKALHECSLRLRRHRSGIPAQNAAEEQAHLAILSGRAIDLNQNRVESCCIVERQRGGPIIITDHFANDNLTAL